MFDNIGGKIKAWASVIAWIGIIASILSGIVLCSSYDILVGLLVAVVGSLSAWLGSFMQYGFGQLIENSDYLVKVAKSTQNSRYSAQTYQQFTPVPPTTYQPMHQPVHAQYNPDVNQKSSGIPSTNSASGAVPNPPASPWVCYSCGHTNRATVNYCVQCNTSKGWSEEKQKYSTSKTYENYVIGSSKP